MAYLEKGTARIYYEETGTGEPVILNHGLIENAAYWGLPGVTGLLAEHFHVISMEMRGHGRTRVDGGPAGFDEETVARDIIDLADHLNIGRFHLVTHSTSGFAAVRYAMNDSSRFASLILANTGSFTSFFSADEATRDKFYIKFAANFEKLSWDKIIENIKRFPAPFFRGVVDSDRCDELLAMMREIVELNDRTSIAAFIRSFYKDADPRVEGLRKITCPVLVIYGEKDDLFIESSKLMAAEIPRAKLIRYDDVGHMTALEVPERLAGDLINFFKDHPIVA